MSTPEVAIPDEGYPPSYGVIRLGRWSTLDGARLHGTTITRDAFDTHEVMVTRCDLTECDLVGLRWDQIVQCKLIRCRLPQDAPEVSPNRPTASGSNWIVPLVIPPEKTP